MPKMELQSSSRPSTTQTVAIGAASTQATNAVGTETYHVRLAANQNCYYLIGVNPTAAQTSVYLPVHWVEYVRVNPGEKIAVIQAPTGGADTAGTGTLSITELT